MKLEEQTNILKRFQAEMEKVMLGKGNDYANEDRLSAFKQVAFITGLTEEQVISVFLATKIARLSNLFSGKEPNNESIDDSILDLANYAALLQMIRVDKHCKVIRIDERIDTT